MMESLVGGALVLLGVLVTQLVHSLTVSNDRKERRQRLLREKYGELCESILDSTSQVLVALKLTGPDLIVSSPPAAPQRSYYLALVYFPELRDATREYNNSVVAIFQFALGFCESAGSTPAGILATQHPDYARLHRDMNLKRSALEKAIEEHAQKYTEA